MSEQWDTMTKTTQDWYEIGLKTLKKPDSRRDWFAGCALIGILGGDRYLGEDLEERAWRIADEMVRRG